jgi:heptaprenyl diphosphate synthase
MTSTADGNSLALPVLDTDLESRLRARMLEVEERLVREVRSEAAFITEAARHRCSRPRPGTPRGTA